MCSSVVVRGKDRYKNLTEQFRKETNDYKKRLSKTGRHSAKDGWKVDEYRYGESCDLCGCPICVLGLPRPIIVWYGFAEERCSHYIRSLQK